MAESLAFDFSAPLADVHQVSPTGHQLPPVNGTTPQSRHASWTGAVRAQETRRRNIERLRALWVEPWTLNQVAAITCLPLSSVCSLKSAIDADLEVVDWVTVDWPTGKSTKRARWQLRACAQRPTR